MQEPIWVRDDIVLAVHRRQIAEHGGDDGIRDAGLLQSALDRPRNLFRYGSPAPSITDLAASYTVAICQNHPFVDGNKRTALVIGQLFLRLNGLTLAASQVEKYRLIMRLASSEIGEQEVADWFRDKTR